MAHKNPTLSKARRKKIISLVLEYKTRFILASLCMVVVAGASGAMPLLIKPIMDDIGIFISTDPVAIDRACYDMVAANGKKFRGHKAFAYAEGIGLGSADYSLHEVT